MIGWMPRLKLDLALTTVLLCLLIVSTGCQQSKYPLVQFAGTVTFDGGECPAPGQVTLQPVEIAEGLPKRPASGRFDADGKFTIDAFSDSSGVLPGRYLVEVTCFAGAPDPKSPDPWGAVDYIADDYEPTEVTVSADDSKMTYDIDVPRRKR